MRYLKGKAARQTHFLKLFFHLLSYRRKMPVTEIAVYSPHDREENSYCICPRCAATMEREYVGFCNQCGQRLGWKNFQNARIIYR